MDWQGWFTLAVVLLALGAMVRELAGPDLIMGSALIALAATGVLTPDEAYRGFANPAVIAVGTLFMVSAGLRETGVLDMVAGRLLGSARRERGALARIGVPVAGLSAFLNNAPIVAMMTPTLIDWARRRGYAPSRFLIPLSYSSILGSITTIIGTSTILTVVGLMAEVSMPRFSFFELAPVGVPIAVAGLLYLVLVAPRLLPSRKLPADEVGERRREYTTTMIVEPGCPLVSQTVEAAGLRHLEGLFLVEIDQGGRVFTPVAPDHVIREGDRLVFAGVVSTIIELQRIQGLVPASDDEAPAPDVPEHRLIEAVVSSSSPLVDQSIRDANFRTVYDAAVIAVHRNGERVQGKIGGIVLRPGDTLLMQGAPGFMRAHGNSQDFFLVSEIAGTERPRSDRAFFAVGILGLMVLAASVGSVAISVAAPIAAGALILTRCLNGRIARQSVNWSILIVIGAGLGVATAMQKTGAAAWIANLVVGATFGLGPFAVLIAIYVLAVVLAELLHHNAAVAIMFPIAVAAAQQVGADPRSFIIAMTFGSCCAFASPVAYQTHLIVYGPGGYRFTDFVRTGIPLDLLCGIVALWLVPRVWPL